MAIAIINPTTGQLEREFAPHTTAEVASKIAEAFTGGGGNNSPSTPLSALTVISPSP